MADSEDLTRSELRLIRQAIRQDWPIPPDVKRSILQRLIDYLDREHIEGQTCSDRQVVAAARTLVSFMKLSIEQQKIDIDRDRLEGKRSGRDLSDLVAEAEQRAEARRCERTTDGAA